MKSFKEFADVSSKIKIDEKVSLILAQLLDKLTDIQRQLEDALKSIK